MAKCLFQQRHYEAVAEILRERARQSTEHRAQIRNLYPEPESAWLAAVRSVQAQLSALFYADNPPDTKGHGFKPAKFKEACEP